ncbi:MAG: exodeoxyribonuclease V beta subunit, partial [bacterium]
YEGKYYLVDWKSNHLGGNLNDYSRDLLESSIVHDLYLIQYHIYSLALLQFLKLRGLSYDQFGGAFYLYLRGVHPESKDQTGVYFDRPSKALMDTLTNLFISI